jgi:hypothetical protein
MCSETPVLVYKTVALSFPTHSSTLMMETANSFETLAPMYHTIHHTPEGISFTFTALITSYLA